MRLHGLLTEFNPALPDLQADITELADFAATVDSAAPDLLDALEDFTVTSRTIVEQRADLRALLTGLTTASDDLREFLAANGDNLVDLAAASRPTLESLARYAPEFPCLFSSSRASSRRRTGRSVRTGGLPGIHITLEIVNNRGPYVPGTSRSTRTTAARAATRSSSRARSTRRTARPRTVRRTRRPHPTPPWATRGLRRRHLRHLRGDERGELAGGAALVAELTAARNGGSPDAVPAWSTLLVGPLYRGGGTGA